MFSKKRCIRRLKEHDRQEYSSCNYPNGSLRPVLHDYLRAKSHGTRIAEASPKEERETQAEIGRQISESRPPATRAHEIDPGAGPLDHRRSAWRYG
jgi:hypothetical protein